MGAFTKVGRAEGEHRNWLQPSRLESLMVILLIVGVGFRFGALDHKIYWHDEVYTSMRAAGFTRQEIDAELFQNRFVTAPTLQKFQQIKPGSTYGDTLQSLIIEDPQHPPLYFWLARFWMQQFGSSILVSRMLPVLISLLSLPLMYGLAMELFNHRLSALLATVLLALSPFDILFAQTARQYSLLTAVVLASSWLLLRAMRCSSWRFWASYGLSVAVGFYTHPFFALTLAAHGAYVTGVCALQPEQQPEKNSVSLRPLPSANGFRWQPDRRLGWFSLAVVGSLVLYSPWIWVLLHQYKRAAATTDWTNATVGWIYLLKLWTLSFTSLFVDLDFGFSNPLTYLLRLPFALLILAALYRIYRHPSLQVRLFVLFTALVPFLLLVLPDLLMGGRRSSVSRYLISAYPGIQLAVAHLLGSKVTQGKTFWRGILGFSVVCSLISCGVSAMSNSWWNKDLSYHNAEVVAIVDAAAERSETSPILISDMGDDATNMGDLISMSYHLKSNVNLFLVSRPPSLILLGHPSGAFLFRASQSLETAVAQQGWQTRPVSRPARLWQVE
jgi:uncharacterized membrane protein